MSRDKAWLLGFLAGDGSIVKTCIQWACGLDRPLALEVNRITKKVFGLSCRIVHRPRLRARDKGRVWFAFLHSSLTANYLKSLGVGFSTFTWAIPPQVLLSNALLGAWISGMADADGSMSIGRNRRCVTIASRNRTGILTIQAALARLGIRSGLVEDDSSETGTSWILSIGHVDDLTTFEKRVGFRCLRKARKLRLALTKLRPSSQRRRVDGVPRVEEEFLARALRGHTGEDIATQLSLGFVGAQGFMVKHDIRSARPSPLPWLSRKHFMESLAPVLKRMRSEGMTNRQISEDLGLPFQSIVHAFCRHVNNNS